MKKGKIRINAERCKGCLLCIPECKVDEIAPGEKVNKAGYTVVLFKGEGRCTACTLCAIACPECAIEVIEMVEDDKK